MNTSSQRFATPVRQPPITNYKPLTQSDHKSHSFIAHQGEPVNRGVENSHVGSNLRILNNPIPMNEVT